MKRRLNLLILCFVIILAGCAAKPTVTNIPTGPDGTTIATNSQVQAWYTATGNLRALSGIVKQASELVVQANRDGAFPDGPTYVTALNALGRAAQIELQASQFLRAQPNTWGVNTGVQIRIYTQQIGDQLAAAVSSGALGIKNPESQVTFRTLIRTAQEVVSIITSITQVVQVEVQNQEVYLAYAY